MLCLVFLVCALRTNVVFVIIFFTLVLVFGFLTAAYWLLASDYTGNAVMAGKLVQASISNPNCLLTRKQLESGTTRFVTNFDLKYQAAGAVAFVTCMCGWWIFVAIMLAVMDFPFAIPVGDLSRVIKGASEKTRQV